MTLNLKMTKMYIGGKWIEAQESMPLYNPSTGQILAHVSKGTASDIDQAVKAARMSLNGEWGRLSAHERGRLLSRMGRSVMDHAAELADIESADVGKPYSQALADAHALARYLEFYGGAADKIHGETIPYQDGYTVFTLRQPLGVTGHIIPWNYPMQIIGRSIVAALAMGNATVLKPAEDACLTALAFGKIAQDAQLPDGVLNIVPGLGQEVGPALTQHPDVNHISFTGSFPIGSLVQMGAALNAVPVTLELGGKSPHIVFADADIDKAVPSIVNSAIQNAGQTCSAGSRVLIQNEIYDDVCVKIGAAFDKLVVGPADLDFDLGPIISNKQKDNIQAYLDLAKKDGLQLVGRGTLSDQAPKSGFYLPPTFWATPDYNHRLAQEEIFGPVQVAIPFATESEAIAIANGTEFGLVAGVWTQDGGRQMRLAKALKAGQVFLNNYGAAGGVELPFGGVGRSGHGREKGLEALYGFSALKTVAAFHN